jgi:prephenate dehydrogenase
MADFENVAIVGVGLIGGSIGLALRERKLAGEVVGIGRREATLESAKKVGAIDRGTTDLAAGVADAKLVIVCTPVDTIAQFALQVAAACPNLSLITDAGSTKREIVTAVDTGLTGRRSGPRFVGSHPVAGDHRAGVEHARADLLEGRKVVVTPTAESHRAAVLEISAFWRSLGAEVVEMSPAEHDATLAATSHLPHLVATALAAATPSSMLPLAASGWRDTTRVAGGDPKIWSPIFATNRQPVLDALDRFDETIEFLRTALQQHDDATLTEILERAKWIKSSREALGD